MVVRGIGEQDLLMIRLILARETVSKESMRLGDWGGGRNCGDDSPDTCTWTRVSSTFNSLDGEEVSRMG